MPTNESLHFVQVKYNDSRKWPWLVIYGEGFEFASFRTKGGAEQYAFDIRVICDAFRVMGDRMRT